MSARKPFNAAAAVTIGSFMLVLAAAAIFSRFAAGQANASFAARMGSPAAADASWTAIRQGPVIGRLSKKGADAYLVSLSPPGGHLEASVSVTADGEPISATVLEATPPTPYMKRLSFILGSLGQRTDRGASPLDGSIAPLVQDLLETITALERANQGGSDASR